MCRMALILPLKMNGTYLSLQKIKYYLSVKQDLILSNQPFSEEKSSQEQNQTQPQI